MDDLRARLRVLRILVAALFAGPLLMLVVALALRPGLAAQMGERAPVVTYAALAFAAGGVAARIVVPGAVRRTGLRRAAREGGDDDARLLRLLQAETILAAVLLETPSLLASVAYLLEGRFVSVPVAGVLALGILIGFPSRSGVEEWVRRQRRSLEEERALAR